MSRIINIITLCTMALLILRQRKLEQETDRLRSNAGDAFAAVTRHLEKAITHGNL